MLKMGILLKIWLTLFMVLATVAHADNINHARRLLQTHTWTQVGGDINGEATGENSGQSVSISSDGTRVAIGANKNDGASGDVDDDRGLVRVYSESGGTWTQVGDDIDGEGASGNSGGSVSMSSDGTRVAIGAPGLSYVRIYAESGGMWTQVGADIDGVVGDLSGHSVSISADGTRVAIGAPVDAGHVRVYAESGGTWTQVGDDIDGEAAGDQSGSSVSMSSDGARLAIGAPNNDGASGDGNDDRGHVRVYAESGGSWTQVGDDIDGEAAGDNSGGRSVSMSSDGTRVAIGANKNDGASGDVDDDRGHVRVYAESGGTWTQVGDDIDGKAAGDKSGRSVSMSSDGTRVAIGADDAGSYVGHVRVYAESSGTWSHVGDDIDGEADGDKSGRSVSMSSDGTRVAIGAPYNKGNFGDRDGHVRVYYLQIPPCDASAAPTNGNVGDCTSSLASGSTCQPTCTSGYTVSGTSSCSLGTLTAATCSLPPTNYCLPSQDWQYHCGPEPYTGSLTCPIAQLSCGGGCNDATTGSTYDQCNQCLSNGHKGLDGGTTCDGSCTLGDISDPCFKGFTPPPSPPPSANMTLPPPPPTPPSPKELVLDDDDHAAGLASFIMVLVATTVNILLTL